MNKHSDFRYCLNTSTIRECKLDVPREVEVASQAGYQGIELWVSEIEEYTGSGGTLSGLKSIVEDSDLEVPNLIAFFQWAHPDDDERHEGLEQARKVFAMAQELGCPWVAAPPFGITDQEDISVAFLADCFGMKTGIATATIRAAFIEVCVRSVFASLNRFISWSIRSMT